MAWGDVDVEEQRMRFVIAASRKEKPLRHLCQEFEISRPTGYEWLRRYRIGGYEAVKEKSRRPHHSPERTRPEIEQRIVGLRQERPDWGARKLQEFAEEGREPVASDHGAPNPVAPRSGAAAGSPSSGGKTIRAGKAE